MNKLWGIGGIVGLALLAIIAFGGKEQPVALPVLTVGGGFERGCTASTTAWTIGLDAQAGTKTVLPARGLRASFSLAHTGANTTAFYRLDSTTPTQINSIPMTATTTVFYTDTYSYRGAVIVNALATTTLIATECLYTN